MHLEIKSWDYLHVRADWADIQQPVFRTEKKKKNQKAGKTKRMCSIAASNSAQTDKSLPMKEKRETKFQRIREASFHPHRLIPGLGSCIPAWAQGSSTSWHWEQLRAAGPTWVTPPERGVTPAHSSSANASPAHGTETQSQDCSHGQSWAQGRAEEHEEQER